MSASLDFYNAGQCHVRRALQVSYDGPDTASDGL